MTEAKHTPGPWERVDTADYAEIHPVGDRLKSAIALVGKPDDANLVAAAPELLAALKNFLEPDQAYHDYHAARMAIAKATAA